MSPLLAQGDRPPINNMNHVAIAYDNFDEAFDFYTKKMGFKEGFTVQERAGPAGALLHSGKPRHVHRNCARQCESQGGPQSLRAARCRLEAYVAALKQRGVMVDEVRERPDDSMVANATDPAGVQDRDVPVRAGFSRKARRSRPGSRRGRPSSVFGPRSSVVHRLDCGAGVYFDARQRSSS